MNQNAVLSMDISVQYPNHPDVLSGVKLEILPGEIVGLVGQSGSGKSTLSLAILGLLGMKGGKVAGSLKVNGRELLGLPERELRSMRGREIGLILQSAMSSLNPALRIRTQMREALRAHAADGDADVMIAEALRSVGLPSDDAFLRRYPSEVSVGQGQRILIAMGLLHNPSLLIADEPTSALDIITQAEVLDLFRKLNREKGSSILFISHDLLSVASICHRVAILNGGQIVECAPTAEIFQNPRNEYTRRLVEAIPVGRALATKA